MERFGNKGLKKYLLCCLTEIAAEQMISSGKSWLVWGFWGVVLFFQKTIRECERRAGQLLFLKIYNLMMANGERGGNAANDFQYFL